MSHETAGYCRVLQIHAIDAANSVSTDGFSHWAASGQQSEQIPDPEARAVLLDQPVQPRSFGKVTVTAGNC
jgi:hypothetical protein